MNSAPLAIIETLGTGGAFDGVLSVYSEKKDPAGRQHALDSICCLYNMIPLYPSKKKRFYSACCLVRPWMEELIPEKNSLEKISKPLKRWMGRSQLLPEIVENVLRSLWWGNGSKQPSPCLQPPKVGGLLRHLLLLLKAPLTSLHF